MKYLVNRETKEHIVYQEHCVYDMKAWRMIDADDEGWITWVAQRNSECPVSSDTVVTVWIRSGDKSTGLPRCFIWHLIGKTPGPKDIIAYRPILPAESKPEAESAWPEDGMPASVYIDVFERFNAAIAASESIPALISEINAMLPEGYEVREKAKPEAVTEDMSDWRNWKKGDVVIRDGAEARWWTKMGEYTVYCEDGKTGVYDDDHEFRRFTGDNGHRFKFHSRPEAK